jgi:hypothetical protein
MWPGDSTTWHFACPGYPIDPPEVHGGLELMDKPMDKIYDGSGQARQPSRSSGLVVLHGRSINPGCTALRPGAAYPRGR